MSKEETRAMFNDLKADFKDFANRIETKVDMATNDINQYAKDTIEHNVRITNLERDVNSIGAKARFNQKFIWSSSGGLAALIFLIKYTS